ncbi:MAG: murein biosynthesis integral membrane protein MurJ [Desulfobacteraceae bacterium]|nr:MAG: murein biosynthesis integral membrane protein MurJ [Desulfobacteraceae bacterium]
MNRDTLGKNIGMASLIMMGSVFLSRVIGLFREMAIAPIGGTSGDVDAYQIAFIIPDILNHVLASGFLSITFIPIFAAYLSKKDESNGWQIFSIILNTFGALLIASIVICMMFTPSLVAAIAPGIEDERTFKLAVRMTRIILPAQFFFFCGGLFMAVQFAKKQFFIPAMAPLVYNLGIIIGGLSLGSWLGMEGFAWGVLLGACAGNFFIQLAGARKAGMVYRLVFSVTHPDFRRYVLITLPFMLGLTMTFSSEFIFKFFGSYLDPGSIAVLGYDFRIMAILVGLFGQAVGTATYPFMAQLAARQQIDELNRLLNQTIRMLFLVIPFSLLFCILRFEIVFILFQRGAFDARSTQMAADVLPFLMIGTVAFTCQTIVTRGYFALQNTWFPAIVGTMTVLASLPVYVLFTRYWGAKGLALGISICTCLQTLLLFELWNRKSRNLEKRSVYLSLIKISIVSLLTAAATYPLVKFLYTLFGWKQGDMGLIQAIAVCIIISTAFITLLSLLATLFRIKEISVLYRRIIKHHQPSKA